PVFVRGRRGDAAGTPVPPAALPRGIGSGPALAGVADQALPDIVRRNTRALERGPRRHGAQLRRVNVPQRAAIPPDRRAGGADDEDVGGSHNFQGYFTRRARTRIAADRSNSMDKKSNPFDPAGRF